MRAKSLLPAVSIYLMLILALGSPLILPAKASQDPSILMKCMFNGIQNNSTCSFTTNSPPSGYSALVIAWLSNGYPNNCNGISGYTQIAGDSMNSDGLCYKLYSTSTAVSISCGYYECAVFEVDFVQNTGFSISGYGTTTTTWCQGGNAAGTQKWIVIKNQACGVDNSMMASSFWLAFTWWYNVASGINCKDNYCSVWTPTTLASRVPIVIGSAGANNNGWDGSPINGNVTAIINSGGGIVTGSLCPFSSCYPYLLVQGGPVSLGGNNNGVIATTTTISTTITQTNLVAPSPTSIPYWIIPMFLILGVGALFLMMGRQAGASGGDTFMLFLAGAWVGSIFGAMANIVPIAFVVILSIVVIFLIWRKVS